MQEVPCSSLEFFKSLFSRQGMGFSQAYELNSWFGPNSYTVFYFYLCILNVRLISPNTL